jgi:hypothetical protein
VDQETLKNLKNNPSIQDQMKITTDWWNSVNLNQDVCLMLQTVKKLFVAKKLTQDLDQAEKVIFKFIGKIEQIDYR